MCGEQRTVPVAFWGLHYNLSVLQQRTLKSITRAVGVGLHSGQRVEITLRPAAADSGIVFRRVDLPQPVDIPVSATAVSETRLASTLSHGDAKVHTVEHLMSACAGLGLDNLHVDVTAEEIPILDGSAASFVVKLPSNTPEIRSRTPESRSCDSMRSTL